MSDLQNKSSQNYFTVFQFLNPKRITKNNPQETDYQSLADFLLQREKSSLE